MEPEQFRQTFLRLKAEIQKVIVGYEALIEEVLTALVAGGHVLLEGVPGLGKTLLVKTLAQALDLHYSRIQFTPDLMPADIIGTNVVMQDEAGRRFFEFQRGPIFSQLALADEITRATPKTQSALLEAMQEHAVTVAGVHYTLEEPFFVLATQNPIEMEGTYPLPEGQGGRFLFKLRVLFPALDDLVKIMDRTTGPELPAVERVTSGATILAMQTLAREVAVAAHVKDYVARVVRATHPEGEGTASMAKRFVRYGASPRGAQALLLAAKVRALLAERANVSFEDLRAVSLPALRHRVILNFEGEAEGADPDDIVRNALEETPELTRVRRGGGGHQRPPADRPQPFDGLPAHPIPTRPSRHQRPPGQTPLRGTGGGGHRVHRPGGHGPRERGGLRPGGRRRLRSRARAGADVPTLPLSRRIDPGRDQRPGRGDARVRGPDKAARPPGLALRPADARRP